MKIVTAQEMRDIDHRTIEEIGIPSLVLMERAGVAVTRHITALFLPKRVTVLSGGGNNGGDGLVIARDLFNSGYEVNAIVLSQPDRLSPDCYKQFEIAEKIGVPIVFKNDIQEIDLSGDAIIVDAILGTGISKDVRENLAQVIDLVNCIDRNVFSVDIPSGISSDTGAVMGKAIKAKWTITFGLPKRGHFLFPGKEYIGELFIEDIGFPRALTEDDNLCVELSEREGMRKLIPSRPAYSNKGNYGHVLVVGGARGKTGAAMLTANSALNTGSGLVTIGVPNSLMDIYQSKVLEEMTLSLPDSGEGEFHNDAVNAILHFLGNRANVLALGPGMGTSESSLEIVNSLIKDSPVPVVIDADGLNKLSKMGYDEMIALLKGSKSPVIITPHPKEMARLLHKESVSTIEEKRIETARKFATESGTVVVLKGVPTVTADSLGNVILNTTGNPGMAVAGSGDVLTGIIASLAGQGLSPVNAAVLGVYIHGISGDVSAEMEGMHSTVASDLIDNLGSAFKRLMSH